MVGQSWQKAKPRRNSLTFGFHPLKPIKLMLPQNAQNRSALSGQETPCFPPQAELRSIESKRLWDALGDDPEQQAKKYTESNRTCDRLVITDGIRYKLFTKPTRFGKWVFSHYLNLLAPKRVHPYKPEVGGAVSFLLKMRSGAAI